MSPYSGTMQPAFPARQVANLMLTAALVCLHFAGGGLPFVAGPVSVMVIEETTERSKLTPGQLDVISSQAPDGFQAWLKKHGEPDPLRIVDKDDSMNQDAAKWQAAFAAKGDTVPWIVIERGGSVLSKGPLPKTAQETMALVKRYGGE